VKKKVYIAILGATGLIATACGPTFPDNIVGMWTRDYAQAGETWIFDGNTAHFGDSKYNSSVDYDLAEFDDTENRFLLNVNGRDEWWITYEILDGGDKLCLNQKTDGYGGPPVCDDMINLEFHRLAY